jgi:hypothetical protein
MPLPRSSQGGLDKLEGRVNTMVTLNLEGFSKHKHAIYIQAPLPMVKWAPHHRRKMLWCLSAHDGAIRKYLPATVILNDSMNIFYKVMISSVKRLLKIKFNCNGFLLFFLKTAEHKWRSHCRWSKRPIHDKRGHGCADYGGRDQAVASGPTPRPTSAAHQWFIQFLRQFPLPHRVRLGRCTDCRGRSQCSRRSQSTVSDCDRHSSPGFGTVGT